MIEADVQARNREIVSEVMKAVFVEREPLRVMHLFSEHYIQHNPLIPNGREAIPAMIAGLPGDFSYQPGMLVADGEHGLTVHLLDRGDYAADLRR